jgi:hypothetical protein
MASIWETISFVARTISTRNQQNVWIELISDLFVLLAPLCKFILQVSVELASNSVQGSTHSPTCF